MTWQDSERIRITLEELNTGSEESDAKVHGFLMEVEPEYRGDSRFEGIPTLYPPTSTQLESPTHFSSENILRVELIRPNSDLPNLNNPSIRAFRRDELKLPYAQAISLFSGRLAAKGISYTSRSDLNVSSQRGICFSTFDMKYRKGVTKILDSMARVRY